MQKKSLILGDEAAVAVLAVEGLHLTPAYRIRIESLQRKGLTTDQIRETLIADLQTRDAA